MLSGMFLLEKDRSNKQHRIKRGNKMYFNVNFLMVLNCIYIKVQSISIVKV